MLTLITALLGSSVDYLSNIESTLGLDTLFNIRGKRVHPSDIVIVAMDEASENQFSVGHDLTRWRSFHTQLIHELQRQEVALIIFDLQFIVSQPETDATFAAAMRSAGNVLVTDCVQMLRRGDEDFYGREECSDTNNTSPVEKIGAQALSEQLMVMRKIASMPVLAEAMLDHAPFFLANDAEPAVIREGWLFLEGLAGAPTLPVLAWFYTLQRNGTLKDLVPPDMPLSTWLSSQRSQCPTRYDVDMNASSSMLQAQIQAVICREDSRYLDYYGPPRSVRMASYSDVYAGKVTGLKDKVVLIGKANRQYSAGKTDFFTTPYSNTASGKTSGVEIMATQLANLLEGRFINAPFPHILMLLGFGLLLGVLFTTFGAITGLGLGLLLWLLYATIAVVLFSRYAIWLPMVMPLLVQLPVALILAFRWLQRDLLRERARIIIFVRQVFPQWINFVPASPGRWHPEQGMSEFATERDVRGLCLATDIEGYTNVAARYTPHQMWELLSEYYQILGLSVHAHEGTIADITGDAMMAVWIDLPADVRSLAACLAALEMEQGVARFNESSQHGHLPTRIGLHEGDLTLGRLEAGTVSHYRAIGDTVNTASRIQGVNKYLGTRILASQEIVVHLDQLVCRCVGAFRLVGKTLPVELYEIVGLKAEVSALEQAFHQQFATGLQLFMEGRWENAVDWFQRILIEQRNDGPTKFYLQLALTYQHNPPAEWTGYVTLDGK